jgi:hypothetical protein
VRVLRVVVGGLLCLTGVVWIGQGVGLVHGSFMTGATQWALLGGAALIVGLGLLSLGRHSRRNAEDGA